MDAVAVFLYLLMRDELPSGRVARLVQEIEKARHEGTEITGVSARGMMVYAGELADRLTGSGETTELDACAVREALADQRTADLGDPLARAARAGRGAGL